MEQLGKLFRLILFFRVFFEGWYKEFIFAVHSLIFDLM